MDTKINVNEIYISEQLREKLLKIENYPITAVTAPSGYGKSVAVKWWDEYRKKNLPDSSLYWLTIKEDDFLDLWRDFCGIVSQNKPELADKMWQMGYPTNGHTLSVMLDLWTQSDRGSNKEIYVVLEDLHILSMNQIMPMLLFALRRMPPNMHVILVSRTSIFHKVHLKKMDRKVLQLTKSAFQLNAQDVVNYGRCCGMEIEGEKAGRIAEFTGGWISLIYLLFRVYERTGQWQFDTKDVYTLVESVILDNMSARVQRFLTVCSITSEFTQEQASFIWNNGDTDQILEQLTEDNSFIRQGPDGKFHTHDLLLQNTKKRFAALSKKEQRILLERLGDWFSRKGESFSALSAYQRGECWQKFMEVVARDRGASISGAQGSVFYEWFERCPDEIREKHPEGVLVLAFQCFSSSDIPNMLRLNNYLQKIVQENPDLTREERDNFAGESQILLGFLRFNSITAMSECQRKACSLMSRPSYLVNLQCPWTFGSPSVLMLYHRDAGRLDAENRELQDCMPYYYKLTEGHGSGAEYVMRVETDFLRGNFEDAKVNYYLAERSAVTREQHSILLALQFCALRYDLFQGDFDKFLDHLEQMKQMINNSGAFVLLPTLDLCYSWAMAILGRTERVPSWIPDENGIYSVMSVVAPTYYTVRNQILLARKNLTRLIACAVETADICREYHMALGVIYAHIHLASAFSLQNRDKEARAELLEALKLAVPDRILIPFAENGIYLRKTMDKVKKEGLYVEELERIFQLMDQIEGSSEKILREKFGVIPDYGLTEREMEVARLAADCMSTTEIAQMLELSPNTVKNHLKHVFDKMGILGTDRNKREKLGEKLRKI